MLSVPFVSESTYLSANAVPVGQSSPKRKSSHIYAEQEMTKQEFREKLQIASGTMTKLNKGQEVSMSVILRICEYFECNIGDICDAVKMD